MIGGNAEASSSRKSLGSTRTKRSSRSRALSNTTSAPALTPALTIEPTPSIAASARKVRTVPPSAVLDPPTPPLESQPNFPSYETTTMNAPRAQPPRRRRRVRYISSDESSSCESEEDTSDDEPPWWTFTARGMNKLRAMRGSVDHGAESAYESGRDAPGATAAARDKERRKRRERSRSKDMSGRTPERMDSADSNPTPKEERRNSTAKLFHPRPFRLPAPLTRRSTDLVQSPILQLNLGQSTDSAPPMTRSNSAPGVRPASTPSGGGEEMGIQRTDTPEAMALTDNEASALERSSPRRPNSVRRFLSHTRTRNSVDGADNFTDSEATMVTSPRFRAKQRLFGFGGVPEEGDVVDLSDPAIDDGSATPTAQQRLRRINANNLRIRLPPPISQHFANGWPHAGSWQDALRTGDVFEELSASKDRGEKEAVMNGNGNGDESSRPMSYHNGSRPMSNHTRSTSTQQTSIPSTAQTPPTRGKARDVDGNHTSTDTDTPASKPAYRMTPMKRPTILTRSSSEAPAERPVRTKRKQRKNRRYRQAQIPPTPGGLGFTPSIRSVGTNGSWKAQQTEPVQDPNVDPFDNVNPFDRIDEEYNLSPQMSRLSEKGKSGGGWGWGLPCSRALRKQFALEGLSAQQRFRRMLFLDARITIYIRLFNLAIVTTLLALAVTIRHKLYEIGYPGIIGPSTTLIIAYASFTMLHVLTAIYREYYGRPIGLWGLRSKMLWVCLDLLFVALWSSATTLAINDYIDTPLDCTPLAPWWTPGYDYYASENRRSMATVSLEVNTPVPDSVRHSHIVEDVCDRQIACFAISIVALLLYCVNMILSLFRIFETVRRTAGGSRPLPTITV